MPHGGGWVPRSSSFAGVGAQSYPQDSFRGGRRPRLGLKVGMDRGARFGGLCGTLLMVPLGMGVVCPLPPPKNSLAFPTLVCRRMEPADQGRLQECSTEGVGQLTVNGIIHFCSSKWPLRNGCFPTTTTTQQLTGAYCYRHNYPPTTNRGPQNPFPSPPPNRSGFPAQGP